MSDTVIRQDPKLTQAADEYMRMMQSKADGKLGDILLWCDWALRNAFKSGAAWAELPASPEECRLTSQTEKKLRDAISSTLGVYWKQYDDEEFAFHFENELLPQLQEALK